MIEYIIAAGIVAVMVAVISAISYRLGVLDARVKEHEYVLYEIMDMFKIVAERLGPKIKEE